MTNRTAVYGPVRTVVWEGRRSDPSPYPDRVGLNCQSGKKARSKRAFRQQAGPTLTLCEQHWN